MKQKLSNSKASVASVKNNFQRKVNSYVPTNQNTNLSQ